MATKANLISAINGFLTAIITQIKVRSSVSVIVDEIYPASIVDTQASETYTTKAGTAINYSIRITKSGNIAHVKGSITNNIGSILAPQNVFTWKTSEFQPKDVVNSNQFNAYSQSGQSFARLFITNNVLSVTNAMPVGTFTFDYTTYLTND